MSRPGPRSLNRHSTKPRISIRRRTPQYRLRICHPRSQRTLASHSLRLRASLPWVTRLRRSINTPPVSQPHSSRKVPGIGSLGVGAEVGISSHNRCCSRSRSQLQPRRHCSPCRHKVAPKYSSPIHDSLSSSRSIRSAILSARVLMSLQRSQQLRRRPSAALWPSSSNRCPSNLRSLWFWTALSSMPTNERHLCSRQRRPALTMLKAILLHPHHQQRPSQHNSRLHQCNLRHQRHRRHRLPLSLSCKISSRQ